MSSDTDYSLSISNIKTWNYESYLSIKTWLFTANVLKQRLTQKANTSTITHQTTGFTTTSFTRISATDLFFFNLFF